MYGQNTDTSVQVHNHTSFPIMPYPPCNAGESQLHAGAALSEQPPSCHQSFQLTDHPGVACHAQRPQTATATGLQEQGDQWNSAHHASSRTRSHIQAGCWEGLIQLGHSSMLHWPADWQFQLLKGTEEYQVVTEVIRATSVGCILWGSPIRWI